MVSVWRAMFLRHSQLPCKQMWAGLPLPIHSTRPAPWHRQSRGFDTRFSTRLLSPRVKNPLLIFLAFACNGLRVSLPQGKGTQHTGAAGSPAVAVLGQTQQRQQFLARRDPGSSRATQSSARAGTGAPQPWARGTAGAWHLPAPAPQGRQSWFSFPAPAPWQRVVGFYIAVRSR